MPAWLRTLKREQDVPLAREYMHIIVWYSVACSFCDLASINNVVAKIQGHIHHRNSNRKEKLNLTNLQFLCEGVDESKGYPICCRRSQVDGAITAASKSIHSSENLERISAMACSFQGGNTEQASLIQQL